MKRVRAFSAIAAVLALSRLFNSGIERYMFIRICWLSRQHGVYQRNNWQLAWKICDWMVRC